MIPKKIFTIWLGDEMPDWIKKCVETHNIEGYQHMMITNDNYYKGSQYVNDAITMKRYAKAVDWLRMWYLWGGGIFLDADTTVLPGKNFDEYLICKMFVGREKNNFVSNAIVGTEERHPLIEKYLQTVTDNFIGSGDLVMAPGMYLFNEMVWAARPGEVSIFPPDRWLPYDHQTDVMEQSPMTIAVHHFAKSWL